MTVLPTASRGLTAGCSSNNHLDYQFDEEAQQVMNVEPCHSSSSWPILLPSSSSFVTASTSAEMGDDAFLVPAVSREDTSSLHPSRSQTAPDVLGSGSHHHIDYEIRREGNDDDQDESSTTSSAAASSAFPPTISPDKDSIGGRETPPMNNIQEQLEQQRIVRDGMREVVEKEGRIGDEAAVMGGAENTRGHNEATTDHPLDHQLGTDPCHRSRRKLRRGYSAPLPFRSKEEDEDGCSSSSSSIEEQAHGALPIPRRRRRNVVPSRHISFGYELREHEAPIFGEATGGVDPVREGWKRRGAKRSNARHGKDQHLSRSTPTCHYQTQPIVPAAIDLAPPPRGHGREAQQGGWDKDLANRKETHASDLFADDNLAGSLNTESTSPDSSGMDFLASVIPTIPMLPTSGQRVLQHGLSSVDDVVKYGLYAWNDHGSLQIMDELPTPEIHICCDPSYHLQPGVHLLQCPSTDTEEPQKNTGKGRRKPSHKWKRSFTGAGRLTWITVVRSEPTPSRHDNEATDYQLHSDDNCERGEGGFRSKPMARPSLAQTRSELERRIGKVRKQSIKRFAKTPLGFHCLTMSRRKLKTALLHLVVPLSICFWAIIFAAVEKWTFFESVYFTVQIFTTVGFGDVKPVTNLGMALFPLASISGITVMAASVAHIAVYLSTSMTSFKIESLVTAFLVVMAISSVLFMYLESWSIWESLFFLYNCASTTGLSEEVPKTTGGRVAFCFLMAVIFSIFTTLVKLIADNIRKGSEAEVVDYNEITRSQMSKNMKSVLLERD